MSQRDASSDLVPESSSLISPLNAPDATAEARGIEELELRMDGPASWTTSQGDDVDTVLAQLDDVDMQDSDPDTTDQFDQDPDDPENDLDEQDELEAKMDELFHELQLRMKEKGSAESLLEVYRSRDIGNEGNNEPRNQAERKLQAIIQRIEEINLQMDYYKQQAFDSPFAIVPDQIVKEQQPAFTAPTGRSHSNSFSTSDYADNEDDRQSIHSVINDVIFSLRGVLDSPSVRLEHLLNLVNILKQNPHAHPAYPLPELVSCLRLCLASTVREIRVNAYRCFRLLYVTGPIGPILIAMRIDFFIVRSLMAESRLDSERIEALKLVRCFISTKNGIQYIPDGVIRAVIAIAEQPDEKLRNACLETLGEMIMADPKPVARCGGFRAVLMALTDNLQDLSDALLKVFLYLLESPETRSYVRQGLDSEMVMSVFTDIYSQGPNHTDRVKASGRIITSMVRSWAGLFDLCAHQKRAIRSLVHGVSLPIQENRKVLLDMLYDIFRINTPKWLKEFLSGKSVKPTPEDLDNYMIANFQELGLVDHHQSIVLTLFLEAGLIETLVSLVVTEGRSPKPGDIEGAKILRKATLLIPELMQLSFKLLPSDKSIHVQSLPSLFKVASNFEDQVLRHVATNAFLFIDTLSRTTSGIFTDILESNRGQRQVDRIKHRVATQIDEQNFRALLNDTQVLSTKDVARWKWNLILEIIQGPMLNPRRLDEAIRGTKFTKRLLAFYRPLNQRYSNQPANEYNQSYTRIGCALFETLANVPEGAKYLAQNKILRLIADGLAQLDPMQGHPGSDPIFSREKMELTMTSGYFEILGSLCKSRSGSKLLEKFKIFNLYYRLSELRSRDDIIKKIITSMDYGVDGHPRVILSKIMTSGYKHIRLFATQHLGSVVKNEKSEFNEWAVRLLCTQLCDPSLDVCHMAVRALDEACSNRKNLDLLIKLRPTLDHLGEAGNPLLLRFLSTSHGFRYLNDMSYIEGEMDDWFMFANRQYMIQIEVKLAKAMEPQRFNPFSEDGKFEDEGEQQLMRAKEVLAPHFYGELTRTDEGCQLLRAKGHFSDYARFIRENCAESKDANIITDLKSVLWAVGHIGSTTGGMPFLEDEDLIKYIVGMAERSKVLSIKGTCYYVLGLLCKTTQGIEILEDYGWQGILHLDRLPQGLCLPKNLDRFLEIPPWTCYREQVPPLVLPLATEGNAVEREVLKATGELGNHILTNGASKNLAKIKAEHASYFSSPDLYGAVLKLLSFYHFRLPIRRFILGLFDIKFEGYTWDWLDMEENSYSSPRIQETPPPTPLQSAPQTPATRKVAQPPLPIVTSSLFPNGSSRTRVDGQGSPGSTNAPSTLNHMDQLDSASAMQSPSPITLDPPEGSLNSLIPSPLGPKEQRPNDILPTVCLPDGDQVPILGEALTVPGAQGMEPDSWTRVEKTLSMGPAQYLSGHLQHPSLDGQNGHAAVEGEEILMAEPPLVPLSNPPPPPPLPSPHVFDILYINKPYHRNFAKEAGLDPLPPRVKVLLPSSEDDDMHDAGGHDGSGAERPMARFSQGMLVLPHPAGSDKGLTGSYYSRSPTSTPPPPASKDSETTKVVVGFNPPPKPKVMPDFSRFMVSSRPRRQYNPAILAARSSNNTNNSNGPAASS